MTGISLRRAGDCVRIGLALAAAGSGTGLWLWTAGTPRARVLAPDGRLVYLHGRAAWSLGAALLGGLGIAVLAWLVVVLAVLWWRRPAAAEARPVDAAVALLPVTLLGLVVLERWLPLGPLTGPVDVLLGAGRVVLLAAVLVTVAAATWVLAVPPARDGGRRWSPSRAAALVFSLVAVVNLAFLPRAVLVGPTGDEPDYLLLAHSLVVDRDLDLRNQIEQRDYQRFTPRLQPHVREGPGGGLYTAHRPGLPLLIAPAYGLGLWTGWPVRVVVMVELGLLAAWLAARLSSWAGVLTGDAAGAWLAALLVAFTAPGFYYAFAIYPELPAALVVLEALRWIGRGAPGAGWGAGLLIAALPWLHEKFVPLAVTLAGLGALAAGGRRRTLVGLGVPLATSALLQACYYQRLYGAPIPVGVHAGFAPWSGLHAGLVGLWLDRDHGLLTLAPVFLVAVAGIPALARGAPRVAGSALAVFASLYLVVGTYREWWGGFAPAPRYLVPVLPILGLALAFGLREWRRRGRGLRVALLALASLAVAAAAVAVPALLYRHAHPIRSLLPGVDWTRYLPGWVAPDDRTWVLTGLLVCLAAAVVAGGRRPAPAGRWPLGLRLTGATLVTLAIAGLAVAAGDGLSAGRGGEPQADPGNAELRAFLDRVAGRADPPPWPVRVRSAAGFEAIRLVYPAPRLPGHGRMVPDALAEGGQARLGERAGADVVFGPYERLARGRYRVAFRLRLARAAEGGTWPAAVATVGVTAERGKNVVVARAVAADALESGAYREVVVEMMLAAPTPDLEWRVRALVPEAVLVDRVTVTPLDLRAVGTKW